MLIFLIFGHLLFTEQSPLAFARALSLPRQLNLIFFLILRVIPLASRGHFDSGKVAPFEIFFFFSWVWEASDGMIFPHGENDLVSLTKCFVKMSSRFIN